MAESYYIMNVYPIPYLLYSFTYPQSVGYFHIGYFENNATMNIRVYIFS